MTKKTLKKKVGAKQGFAADTSRDIWLAGLGAFAAAQKEGGKILEEGSKLFEKLVMEGQGVEGKTRKAAEDTVGDIKDAVGGIKGSVEDRVGSIRQQAAENWDKLEKVFEERVARALGKLGVPTADDIQQLSSRVQNLAERVQGIGAQSGATPGKAKTTRKTTAGKAKTTAAKGGKAKSVARELKAKTAA